jgi:hypothetical protein
MKSCDKGVGMFVSFRKRHMVSIVFLLALSMFQTGVASEARGELEPVLEADVLAAALAGDMSALKALVSDNLDLAAEIAAAAAAANPQAAVEIVSALVSQVLSESSDTDACMISKAASIASSVAAQVPEQAAGVASAASLQEPF